MNSIVRALALLANTIYCHKCGTAHPLGTSYCKSCGAKLS